MINNAEELLPETEILII